MTPQPVLAQRLPDLPRWVEARGLLLQGGAELFGLEEAPALSVVVRDPEEGLVVVVGTPAVAALRDAVARGGLEPTVIAPLDQRARLASALPGWHATRAVLHLPGDTLRLPSAPPGQVGFVDAARLDDLTLPDGLRRELRMGAAHSPLAATFVDGQPVSFCYAGAVTESLWDVSIDTLTAFRRHGYAALAAAFMIRHMLGQGRQPVWGAVEENPASWRLARKLGFVPVDELVLFEPAA